MKTLHFSISRLQQANPTHTTGNKTSTGKKYPIPNPANHKPKQTIHRAQWSKARFTLARLNRRSVPVTFVAEKLLTRDGFVSVSCVVFSSHYNDMTRHYTTC